MKSSAIYTVVCSIALGLAVVTLPGCKEKTESEKIEDAAKDAADKAKDAAKDAADKVGDAAKKTGEAVTNAVHKAGEEIRRTNAP